MVDLEALRAAIRAHQQAGASWDQIADGIGVSSRSVTRWALGGGVLDEGVGALVSDWLARGAPAAAPHKAGKRGFGVALAAPDVADDARSALRRAHAKGIQAKQIGRGLGVSDETVGWWLRGGGMTAESAGLIRSWVARGCPVPEAGRPGRKGRAVPTTPDALVAAGALDPGVEWQAVADRLGATISQVRYWARCHGLALPVRPSRSATRRTKAPAGPTVGRPTPDQLAWLSRPGLPVCQWGSEAGSGVATPSRARACERAGWVEQVGARKWRLTPAGRALVEASGVVAPEPEPVPVAFDARAALGWDVA